MKYKYLLIVLALIFATPVQALNLDPNYPNLQSKSLNSSQEIKNIVILIKFKDSNLNAHHIDDSESISNANIIYNSDELFEMDTVKGLIKVPSFKKYYEQQSYGALSVTSEFFPKINNQIVAYTDDEPIGYYLKYNESNTIGYTNASVSKQREMELITKAFNAVEPVLRQYDPNSLDTNNDNQLDAVTFITEIPNNLPSSIAWGDLLWPHKSTATETIESTYLNKRIGPYNILYAGDYTQSVNLFSFNRGTYGTIIHEFGHILGYSDLYRYASTAKPVGFFDIMGNSSTSNPQNFLTYFISDYNTTTNWHSPLETIKQTTKNITLYKPQFKDKSEKRAIKIQIGNNTQEYFIAEYHEKQNTYDDYSVDKSGLIIYRVNEKNKFSGNNGYGANGEGDHIFIFRPNEPNLGAAEGNLTEATLNIDRPTLGKKISSNETFDNQTIYYSNGSNTGIIIEVKSQTEDSITFDVIFPEIQGSGTITDPYLISNTEDFLYLMKTDTSNKYYKLLQDLDFTNINYPKIDFQGNLDGNNKTLRNITSTGTGVFSSLGIYGTHTEIKNLFVENIDISPDTGNHLGGLASTASNITISNVHLLSGTISNVASSINSVASTGGFVGASYNDTIIENSSSNLDVTSPKNVGGFIGLNMNTKIKTCFTTGTVTGNESIGAFIGLQYITDNVYNVPDRVYYDYNKNKINGVGGYASWHRLDVLDASSLSIGIIGISIAPNITLEKSIPTEFQATSLPSSNIDYTLTSENPNIVKISNNTMLGLTKGTTKVYTDITVGTNKMRLITNVTVNSLNELTEDEVLEYFNLTKKNNYIIIDHSTSTEDLKTLLKTHPEVTFKNLKDSHDAEVSNTLITTNMSFTINFNNTDYTYKTVVLGDVTEDGVVDLVDVMYALRISLNLISNVKEISITAGDINNSKEIDLADVMYILRLALNLTN